MGYEGETPGDGNPNAGRPRNNRAPGAKAQRLYRMSARTM